MEFKHIKSENPVWDYFLRSRNGESKMWNLRKNEFL